MMAATPDTQAPPQDIARGVLGSVGNNSIVLELPGTSYKIQLACDNAEGRLADRVGKRIKGTVHAEALRLHKASGGGRFIEPVWGEPRIIAGLVLALDESRRRVLVDMAIPVWMKLVENQPADEFRVGDLVNCYVRSGTRFELL